jgi:hypothetical protein
MTASAYDCALALLAHTHTHTLTLVSFIPFQLSGRDVMRVEHFLPSRVGVTHSSRKALSFVACVLIKLPNKVFDG